MGKSICQLCKNEPATYMTRKNKEEETHYIGSSCIRLFPIEWVRVSYNPSSSSLEEVKPIRKKKGSD